MQAWEIGVHAFLVSATNFQDSCLAVDWLAVGSRLAHHVRHIARKCSLLSVEFGCQVFTYVCIPWSELYASQHCFFYTHMWSGGVVLNRLYIHCSRTSWNELEQSCWALATWINGISRGFYHGRHVSNSVALSFLWWLVVSQCHHTGLRKCQFIFLWGLSWLKSVPMVWDRCKNSGGWLLEPSRRMSVCARSCVCVYVCACMSMPWEHHTTERRR